MADYSLINFYSHIILHKNINTIILDIIEDPLNRERATQTHSNHYLLISPSDNHILKMIDISAYETLGSWSKGGAAYLHLTCLQVTNWPVDF